MAHNNLNILVIDDDPVYRNLLRTILKDRVDVLAVEAPSLAFKVLENDHVDIVICDFKLPEMDGLQVLQKIKAEHPGLEVIMISSTGDIDTVIESLRKGAADYFRKPFTANEIWLSLERTRRYVEINEKLSRASSKNATLKAQVNSLFGMPFVGDTEGILAIKHQVEMVAQTPDTSVLIIGESGTGKELVARGIHNLSRRKDEIFGAVNMSAIPESLFESEFFGHKKGSFTGAIADRAGWFESANGGTLFFDEIGEMSMSLQVKLLRVLEDRRFVKVGAQREQQFDIRVVSATNKSVDVLTDGKSFRLDLFHRLGTFVIHLPPLRERKSDIPALTDFFLSSVSKKMGKNITSIHPSVHEVLASYHFPGNIRELRNLVERAVIICQGKELTPQHFGLGASFQPQGIQAQEPPPTFDLHEIERVTIVRALQKVQYNKAEAARLLNIEWNALYRRIQKHGIEMPFD
jgi:DNA-binding NtrC family response regulator